MKKVFIFLTPPQFTCWVYKWSLPWRLHPSSPASSHRTLGGGSAGNSLSTPLSSDWRSALTNHTPTSSFRAANHYAATVHLIYGAIGVGWAVRGPQKFDSFTGETPVQRLFHFTFQFIFPEHWSLWAWGCHTQKTTTRRQTIPAAWAKRKRTGRLRKVRLVFSERGGGRREGRMRLSSSWWQTAWIVNMPPDWQPLFTAPSVVLRREHQLIPSGACTDVTGMLRLCVLAVMRAWLSQQQLATAFRSLAWI